MIESISLPLALLSLHPRCPMPCPVVFPLLDSLMLQCCGAKPEFFHSEKFSPGHPILLVHFHAWPQALLHLHLSRAG